MRSLTFRQEQVLAFIRSCCADRGRPPTLREICNHLKVASTNAVADHLKALEKKGYLTRGAKRTSHNIRLADGQSGQQRALGYLADLQATPRTAHQRELLQRAQENLGAGEQVQGGGVDASS